MWVLVPNMRTLVNYLQICTTLDTNYKKDPNTKLSIDQFATKCVP